MFMALLGRDVPNCAPTVMFTDPELAFLRDYADLYGLTQPELLGDAVGDPDPGIRSCGMARHD